MLSDEAHLPGAAQLSGWRTGPELSPVPTPMHQLISVYFKLNLSASSVMFQTGVKEPDALILSEITIVIIHAMLRRYKTDGQDP